MGFQKVFLGDIIMGSSIACYTADSRPCLWKTLEDPNHPLNTAWPVFLDNSRTFQRYVPMLTELHGLSRFQFLVVERVDSGEETVIACGRSVPFFSPELLDHTERQSTLSQQELDNVLRRALPDGGYDTILARGVEQALRRNGRPPLFSSSADLTADQRRDVDTWSRDDLPNVLCALSVTVNPARRAQGIAELVVDTMRQAARNDQLRALVVPLRPTRKQYFTSISMSEYISWTHGPNGKYPFDPWLRKHIRLGGRILKLAPQSMVVEGTTSDWEHWTGINCLLMAKRLRDKCGLPSSEHDLHVAFPGGLAPLVIKENSDQCIYTEPNVWLHHDIWQ